MTKNLCGCCLLVAVRKESKTGLPVVSKKGALIICESTAINGHLSFYVIISDWKMESFSHMICVMDTWG